MKIKLLLCYTFRSEGDEVPRKVDISYLIQNECVVILCRRDLVNILKNDEAVFFENNIKYFDKEYNGWIKFPEMLPIDVSEQNGMMEGTDQMDFQEIHILLNPKHQQVKYKKDIQRLQQEVIDLKKRVATLDCMIQQMSGNQNFCQYKLLLANDNQQIKSSSQLIDPDNQEEIKEGSPSAAAAQLAEGNRVSSDTQLEANKQIEKNQQYHQPQLHHNFHELRRGGEANLHHTRQHHDHINKDSIDIAILYSDPLITYDKKNQLPIPAGEPVDYEQEIRTLKETLQKIEKHIIMRVEIATLENLELLMNKAPTILHLICHGDYHQKNQRFYLAFENNKGELDECDSKRLKQLLYVGKNHRVELVFINACHSAGVGQVFLEAGVPVVIAVQSELKIEDQAAQIFAKSFYMHLFSGETIQVSFDAAQGACQAKRGINRFTCCCAHAHDPNCLWQQYACDEVGFPKAHADHMPKCQCPGAQEHLHRVSCVWAQEFVKRFDSTYNEDEFQDLMQDPDQIFHVCCCEKLTAQKKICHDESLKFQLMLRDKNNQQLDASGINQRNQGNKDQAQNKAILKERPKGEVKDITQWEIGCAIYSGRKIFGRNIEIHKVFDFLTNLQRKERAVLITGPIGMGKTAMVKQMANYCYERGFFRDGIMIEEFEGVKSIFAFYHRMRQNYASDAIMLENLRKKKCLYILDNVDSLYENCKEQFITYLRNLIERTVYIKIILISSTRLKLNLNEQHLELKQLQLKDAKDMLIFYAKDRISNSMDAQYQLDYILNNMERSPKNISAIIESLKTESLSHIKINIENFVMQKGRGNEQDIIVGAINQLKQQNPEAFELLLIISQFPYGLMLQDFQAMKQLNMIPIYWKDQLRILTKSRKELGEDKQQQQSIELQMEENLPEEEDEKEEPYGKEAVVAEMDEMENQQRQVYAPQQKSPVAVNSQTRKSSGDAIAQQLLQQQQFLQQHQLQGPEFQIGEFFYLSLFYQKNNCEQLIFKTNKFVLATLKEHFSQQLIPKEILILEYLSHYSKMLLRNLIQDRNYNEKLIEYSGISQSGLWAQNYNQMTEEEQNLINLCRHQHNLSNFSQGSQRRIRKSFTIAFESQSINAKQLFQVHQNNFQAFFTHDDFLSLIHQMEICKENDKKNIKKFIEVLCHNVPTIYKMMNKLHEAEELSNSSLSILKFLIDRNLHSKSTYFLQSKINFLLVNIYYEEAFKSVEKNDRQFELMVEALNTSTELIKSLSDKDDVEFNALCQLVNIETAYLKASIVMQNFQNSQINYNLEELLKSKGGGKNEKAYLNQACEMIQEQGLKPLNQLQDKMKFYYFELNKPSQRSSVSFDNIQMIVADTGMYQRQTDKQQQQTQPQQPNTKDLQHFLVNLEILRSKFYLQSSRIQRKLKLIEKETRQYVESALRVFEQNNLTYLEILTRLEVVYLVRENYEKEGIRAGSKLQLLRQDSATSNQQMNKTIEELTLVKKNTLEPAYKLVMQTKDKDLDSEYRALYIEINQLIRSQNQHIIQIMRSLPLVDKVFNEKSGLEQIKAVGFQCRTTSAYRSQVLDMLARCNREVAVKFENLNHKNFFEVLEKGCCICHADFYFEEKDKIILENDELPIAQKYSFQQFQEYFTEHQDEFGQIDILILGASHGKQLAELFQRVVEAINKKIIQKNDELRSNYENPNHFLAYDAHLHLPQPPNHSSLTSMPSSEDELQQHKQPMQQAVSTSEESFSCINSELKSMPFIVTFEFNNFEELMRTQGFNQFALEYLKTTIIQQFSLHFMEILIMGSSIQDAFDKSKEFSLQTVIKLSPQIQTIQQFNLFLGEGPLLLVPSNKEATYKPFEKKLKKAPYQDISSVKSATNIGKTFLRFTGRNKDIYNVLQHIMMQKCINIYGEKGVGKTEFGKELGYLIASKNLFKHGVYYFNLRDLKEKYKNNLRDLMRESLGEEFSQKIHIFFNNKQMLLIFDNFERDLQKSQVEYFDHIFSSLRHNHMQFIIISNEQYDIGKNLDVKKCLKYQLPPLNFPETCGLLDSLINLDKIIFEEEGQEEGAKKQDRKKMHKEYYDLTKGNPKKLLKHYKKNFNSLPTVPKLFLEKRSSLVQSSNNNNHGGNIPNKRPSLMKSQSDQQKQKIVRTFSNQNLNSDRSTKSTKRVTVTTQYQIAESAEDENSQNNSFQQLQSQQQFGRKSEKQTSIVLDVCTPSNNLTKSMTEGLHSQTIIDQFQEFEKEDENESSERSGNHTSEDSDSEQLENLFSTKQTSNISQAYEDINGLKLFQPEQPMTIQKLQCRKTDESQKKKSSESKNYTEGPSNFKQKGKYQQNKKAMGEMIADFEEEEKEMINQLSKIKYREQKKFQKEVDADDDEEEEVEDEMELEANEEGIDEASDEGNGNGNSDGSQWDDQYKGIEMQEQSREKHAMLTYFKMTQKLQVPPNTWGAEQQQQQQQQQPPNNNNSPPLNQNNPHEKTGYSPTQQHKPKIPSKFRNEKSANLEDSYTTISNKIDEENDLEGGDESSKNSDKNRRQPRVKKPMGLTDRGGHNNQATRGKKINQTGKQHNKYTKKSKNKYYENIKSSKIKGKSRSLEEPQGEEKEDLDLGRIENSVQEDSKQFKESNKRKKPKGKQRKVKEDDKKSSTSDDQGKSSQEIEEEFEEYDQSQ